MTKEQTNKECLSSIDKYDIESCFDVLDEDKVGRITLENFHTLYLGLGFQPKQLTIEELKEQVIKAEQDISNSIGNSDSKFDNNINITVHWNSIPFDIVLNVLEKYNTNNDTDDTNSYRGKKRNRHHREMNKCFESVDSKNKGYISVEDIIQLSKEVEGEPITMQEAEMMLLAGSSKNDIDAFNTNANTAKANKMSKKEFFQIFAPKQKPQR